MRVAAIPLCLAAIAAPRLAHEAALSPSVAYTSWSAIDELEWDAASTASVRKLLERVEFTGNDGLPSSYYDEDEEEGDSGSLSTESSSDDDDAIIENGPKIFSPAPPRQLQGGREFCRRAAINAYDRFCERQCSYYRMNKRAAAGAAAASGEPAFGVLPICMDTCRVVGTELCESDGCRQFGCRVPPSACRRFMPVACER